MSMNSLSPVLETADRAADPRQTESRRRVSFDQAVGRVCRSTWNPFRRQRIDFIVQNAEDATARFRSESRSLVIEPKHSGRRLHLAYDYQVACEPGAETRLVESLCRGSDPRAELEARIDRWLGEHLRARWSEVQGDVAGVLSDVCDALVARALGDLGLRLKINVEPQAHGDGRTVEFETRLSVQLRDHADPISVTVRAGLVSSMSAHGRTLTYPDGRAGLERALRAAIEDHFATRVSLHALYFERGQGVRDALRKVLEPIAASAGRELRALRVEADVAYEELRSSADITHRFDLRPKGYPGTLRVDTRARLRLTDLGQFVAHGRPDLTAWFEKTVEGAASDEAFGATFGDLAERYILIGDRVRSRVVRAAREIGHHIDLTFDIRELSARGATHSIALRDFEVHLVDSTESVAMSIDVELAATSRYGNEVSLGAAEIRGRVEQAIRRHFRRKVKIQDFRFGLDGAVKKDIEDYLNGHFERHNLETVRLLLRGDYTDYDAEVEVTVRHDVVCRVADYPREIQLEGQLRMRLADLGDFRLSGISDIRIWAAGRLEAVAQGLLFETRFSDLISDYESYKSRVRHELERELSAVGYRLEHFTAVSNLQIDRLLRPFRIGPFADDYQTSAFSVKVRLEVEVEAKLYSPDGKLFPRVQDLLSQDADVREDMERAMRNRIADLMQDVKPAEFYQGYRQPVGDEPPDWFQARSRTGKQGPVDGDDARSYTLERHFRDGLAELLKAEYGAIARRLTVRPVDSDVTRTLTELMADHHVLDFEVSPFGGELPIPFTCELGVNGIANWLRFLSRLPTPEKIRDAAIRVMTRHLKELSTAALNTGDLWDASARLSQLVDRALTERYGLSVRIVGFQRGDTLIDVKRRNTLRRLVEVDEQKAIEHIDHTLTEDRQQRDARLQEIRNLRRRLQALSDQLVQSWQLDEDERQETEDQYGAVKARLQAITPEDYTRAIAADVEYNHRAYRVGRIPDDRGWNRLPLSDTVGPDGSRPHASTEIRSRLTEAEVDASADGVD